MPNLNNQRIFYACQAVAIAPAFTTSFTVDHLARGVQSVGVNTSFNLEQVFELGQISIYENIEGLPDVEVTIEKVLDGYELLYKKATKDADSLPAGIKDTLVARTKERCDVVLGIYPDNVSAATGNAPTEIYMSGMYINSISYTLPVEGNCTESITLVGNNKLWNQTRMTGPVVGPFTSSNADLRGPDANVGVLRRQDVRMDKSILPLTLNGIGSNISVGNNWDGVKKRPKVHVQNISISADLGREDLLELGKKSPYYRAPNFPIEVTCEIEVLSTDGDYITALEEGQPTPVTLTGGVVIKTGDNTAEQPIKIVLADGTVFDLGTKNRLSSVSYGGGDAGGGNVTQTYSYSTFNDLTIGYDGTAVVS